MIHRHRGIYAGAVVLVILLGLASRKFPEWLLAVLGKYPGDALWALMVFFALGIIFPTLSTWKLATLALGISFAVEFGQLYRAPWIVAVRHTTLGHLVLGSAFGWADLLAYSVGVTFGVSGEILANRWQLR